MEAKLCPVTRALNDCRPVLSIFSGLSSCQSIASSLYQQIHRHSVTHTPDREAWERIMAPAHAMLAPVAADAGLDELSGHVDPYAARREYVENGQAGLDELLAALDGGFEVGVQHSAPSVHLNMKHVPQASCLGGGFEVGVQHSAPSPCSLCGPRVPTWLPCSGTAVRRCNACSRNLVGISHAASAGRRVQGAGGAAADASTPEGDPLTKVVLARRTNVLFRGELDPLALLAALQVGPRCAPFTSCSMLWLMTSAMHPCQQRGCRQLCLSVRHSGLHVMVGMAS
jgi:hypothetical protein